MTVVTIQGEDRSITISLKEQNAAGVAVAADVSGASAISATLTPDNSNTAALTVDVNSGEDGEDYANGVIVLVLTDVQTAALDTGLYRLSITVTEDGLKRIYPQPSAVKIQAL